MQHIQALKTELQASKKDLQAARKELQVSKKKTKKATAHTSGQSKPRIPADAANELHWDSSENIQVKVNIS